jgi:hypothetical protein
MNHFLSFSAVTWKGSRLQILLPWSSLAGSRGSEQELTGEPLCHQLLACEKASSRIPLTIVSRIPLAKFEAVATPV